MTAPSKWLELEPLSRSIEFRDADAVAACLARILRGWSIRDGPAGHDPEVCVRRCADGYELVSPRLERPV